MQVTVFTKNYPWHVDCFISTMMKKLLFIALSLFLVSGLKAQDVISTWGSNIDLADTYKLTKVDDSSFKLTYDDPYLGKSFDYTYDIEFYDQFTKTLALAKEKGALVYHLPHNDRGTVVSYTEKYALSITYIELDPADVELQKIDPNTWTSWFNSWGNKIVIKYKKNNTIIAPVCYGCGEDEMEVKYKRYLRVLEKAKTDKEKVIINTGVGKTWDAISIAHDADTYDPNNIILVAVVSDKKTVKTVPENELTSTERLHVTGWMVFKVESADATVGEQLLGYSLSSDGIFGDIKLQGFVQKIGTLYKKTLANAKSKKVKIRVHTGIKVDAAAVGLTMTDIPIEEEK